MTRRVHLSIGLGASILVAAGAVALVRPSTPLAAAATGVETQPQEKQALHDAEASFQATAPRADKHADLVAPLTLGLTVRRIRAFSAR